MRTGLWGGAALFAVEDERLVLGEVEGMRDNIVIAVSLPGRTEGHEVLA
jgi:hypothetical protein